ncbi:TonB-dependent receptor [Hymenobacter sp. CRA2]|uniref:TonB-dependent receptor n=1 Tax=Hymenobacter sp. CRA2 TaxID=1955620 RepID=UPI0009902F98|nr:TonB-dependent receptor [Hymenobacter sp. CRA2]OON67344.1 hypothetical protein B0919_17890 [Hymenobacter sp. CRA2]
MKQHYLYYHLQRVFAALLLVLTAVTTGWSQGATTAAMSGTITDKGGMGLPGATVIAVHTPTNTQYVAPTNSDGRYNIQNMRVGGPYTVRITFVGYQETTREGVFLTLGQNQRLDVNLSETTTQLAGVEISGRQDPVINSGRTGAATTVQREQIERLPTLNRSLNDFTRLTPQANGQSFGGRNSGFNNITVDGAIFNNSFGLSSTVGGQASAQPISLDAVDQIQVSIAPYDVRQGSFTGAGINLVTRSGTNKVQGSLYGFYRNENLVGSKVGDVKQPYPNFDLKNMGFRLGGPIVKDELFFFVNGERERRNDAPTGNYTANRSSSAPPANSTVSRAAATDLDNLRTFLVGKYGYDPGAYENYQLRQNSDKITARLDWNISQNHRLNLKYNFLRSYADINPSSSGAIGGQSGTRAQSQFGLPFFSSYYTINNNLDSWIGELNSTFGSRFANNLTAGYSRFRDFRESPGGGLFPLVDIGNATSGLSPANSRISASNALTTFGYEPFTAFNILNSDVYQFGDNFTAFLGKHNVTVGTYNELYRFRNGFAPNYYGSYQFNSLEDFYAAARTPEAPNGYTLDANRNPVPRATGTAGPAAAFAQRYQLQYSALPGGAFPFAVTKAAQLGLFAQDEWTPKSNLRITAGLRADLPIIFSDIERNVYVAGGQVNGQTVPGLTFRDGVRIETDQQPKSRVLFSPRVGFNWDVFDNKRTQLRGGTGIFTSRVPFVWISNQASNNGVQFGSVDLNNSNTTTASTNGYYFTPDVDAYRNQLQARGANTQYNLAVTDRNFKFPQVWRSSLGIDQEVFAGIIFTFDALFTKDLNAVYHQNVNLPAPAGNAVGADNRPIYYTFGGFQPAPNGDLRVTTANNRIFNGQGGVSATNPVITDAILMRNTNKGYSYSLTGQLQKTFGNGLFLSAAYTFTDSRSVNDGGSIAQSIWRDRVVSGDPNADVLSYSQYLQQHRVVASASYRREYLGHLGTTLSLFYEGAPAINLGTSRFSYIYANDMNGDGQTNDLMYIPRSQSEIVLRDIALTTAQGGGTYTAAQQWADLDAYISQDKYLNKHRGGYAERNGAVRPWQHRIDARILQDLFTNIGESRNTLQLSLDVFNLGNLLNSKWGVIQTPNRSNLLTFDGYNAQNQPVFEYRYFTNPVRNGDGSVTPGVPLSRTFRNDTGNINSRWQMQVGLRYIFN